MKKTIVTDQLIVETIEQLNKMIDTLALKKKFNEEAVVKVIYNHLGFTIAYVDGEKEFNAINNEIKKDLKVFLKEKKAEEKEEAAFAKAMAKANAKKTSKKVSKKSTKKVSKKK